MISEKQKAYKSLSAESKKYDYIFHIIKNLLLIFSLLLYIFITIAQTVHLYAPQLPVEG